MFSGRSTLRKVGGMPQQEENRNTGTDDVCHNELVATDMRVRHQTQPRDITPRSLPVPISGSSSNGFYVGTVRDPRVPSSSMSSTSDKALKEECEEFQKENCYDRESAKEVLVLLSVTTFFFDEEMHLLANELAKSDRRHNLMSYEKLASPAMALFYQMIKSFIAVMEDEPIQNYEDLVPGRHRRSGNERVHPNNLYTAFSRSRKRLERDLPSWIDVDPNGKNDELKYWQDRINYVYQNSSKPSLHCDRAFHNNRAAGVEEFHSETELDSSCAGSTPSQQELHDISGGIFGFSDVESDLD
ncbi:unnamed protein product [Angiostrongylus costaricensis]|uniref:Uncharacterized protein n=1 Tax=Angiostrongylus costaricensis TaxID=334426 RepID=A0A0R3PW60_ANGCS|nr:unnamed protein product [Angiostrongylus costaricensis]